MEDDRRRVREYYQVNLDTGRIFWIAFLIGLVLIGILVLGIFVGGGKLTKGLAGFEKPAGSAGGATAQAPTKNGIPLLNLFENNFAAETKYIDAKEAEKAALESSKQTLESAGIFEEPVPEELTVQAAVEQAEKTKYGEPPRMGAAPRSFAETKKKSAERPGRYVEKGDYFIQVASFEKEENARSFAERLRKRLYKVTVEEAQVGERQFYRVRVGPFETKGVAVNTMTTMKRHFDLKDPFVVKKNS
jgi:cell division septation protein DedD